MGHGRIFLDQIKICFVIQVVANNGKGKYIARLCTFNELRNEDFQLWELRVVSALECWELAGVLKVDGSNRNID